MKPKVGERRLYTGQIEVLYPGEHATAIVDLRSIESDLQRVDHAIIAQWIVEPESGLRACARRWRYRLWGRFVNHFADGRPKLDVKIGGR